MAGNVKPIPEGYHSLTPHLVVNDGRRAVEFYQKAFGAEVRGVFQDSPDGKVHHAELKIGDSLFMLADEFPMEPKAGMKFLSPKSLGGSTTTLHLYVENVDAAFDRAVAAGAAVAMPLMDAFWGDRYGQLLDPFGHRWALATRKENLSQEEVKKRGEAFFAQWAKQKK